MVNTIICHDVYFIRIEKELKNIPVGILVNNVGRYWGYWGYRGYLG